MQELMNEGSKKKKVASTIATTKASTLATTKATTIATTKSTTQASRTISTTTSVNDYLESYVGYDGQDFYDYLGY